MDALTLPLRNRSSSLYDPPPLSDWQAARTLQAWEQDERHQARFTVTDPLHATMLENIKKTLDDDLQRYSKRRQVEAELADYIDQVANHEHAAPGLHAIAKSMRACRQCCALGIKPDGGKMFAWDAKCNLVRLCPDEARQETERLSEKYIPPILAWSKAKPNRRVFYAVLTTENFAPGQLLKGKRRQFKKLRAWRESKYIRERLKGALVVQEDPLSALDDWNVHLNTILLVEGEFDFGRARKQWGCNVEFRLLPKNVLELTRAMKELVKYSAQHVGEKSEEKHLAGETAAPPMTAWPCERFSEWWSAQRPTNANGKATAFRRTRSYGCLFNVDYEPPKMDMSQVEWIGSVQYRDGRYTAFLKRETRPQENVDLIPEDKSTNEFTWAELNAENLRGWWRPPSPF